MFFCSFSGAISVPCLGTSSPANWVFVFVLCQKKKFLFLWGMDDVLAVWSIGLLFI